MLTGSAEKTLDTLKQILDDIELVTGESTSKTLLANIKNTISDRHIVQKNFNELLEMYRSEIRIAGCCIFMEESLIRRATTS